MEYSHELYRMILGLTPPWSVTEVRFDSKGERLDVHLECQKSAPLLCPVCSAESPGYDTQSRRWRHLDTCQYQTWIHAEVPRVRCAEHGVRLVAVPWAESGERFTLLFESFAIDAMLTCDSIETLRKRMGVSWKVLHRIQQRAVARGLTRRKSNSGVDICVDETSFQKRHEYVTVVSDHQSGGVLFVSDDRKQESLEEYFSGLSEAERRAIKSVSMDMHAPYIQATRKHLADADRVICFDLFHIAQHLGKAVDAVRRKEHPHLLGESDERLKGTRYLWLRNPEKMSDRAWEALDRLARTTLKTARAWRLKEYLMTALTTWRSRRYVAAAIRRWYSKAIRSRLEPVKKVARMVQSHLSGILNAVWHQRSNGPAESINARIQKLKRKANGYRNREAFKRAILFHLGKLDLYPTLPANDPPT